VNVVLEPIVIVAVAGETVTPLGSPLTETCTDPVKLSALLGVTVMVLVCPWTMETAASAPRVKVPLVVVPLLPLTVEPQPATSATRHTHRTQRRESFA
jgi:hypothetical protein